MLREVSHQIIDAYNKYQELSDSEKSRVSQVQFIADSIRYEEKPLSNLEIKTIKHVLKSNGLIAS